VDELPAPLVSADVDLRGYDFMPLYGDLMLGSRFNATTNDTAWRIGVTLWWKSWNCQVPAASLPDDDLELAMLAGLGRDVKTFRKVRELALHGFVKCSDGRLYHRFLSQHAIEAWKGRQAHKLRTLKARVAALEKRLQNAVTDAEKEHISGLLLELRRDLTGAVTKSVTDKNEACNRVPQREGEGEEEEKLNPLPPADAGGVADAPPGRGVPDCPHEKIIELFHEILPANPRVSEWTEARRSHLRARWRDKARRVGEHPGYTTTEEGLVWWRDFFGYCATSAFLTGRKDPPPGKKVFTAGLPWLLQAEKFANVLEAKYHD
jgi:hypothetical protein